MSLRETKVLVTGAGGFIASHLCQRLFDAGAKVRAFTRYNSRNDPGLLRYLPKEVREALEVVSGDLRDADAVRQAVQGCEIVFHLGALVAIPYSYRNPRETIETNILGTLNVLEASRSAGLRRIVHTSTSEVYGTALTQRITEEHPLQGQSPYSASKIGADKIAQSFNLSFGLPVVTVRPFNTYGPGQSMRAVIPTVVAQALKGDTIQIGALDTVRDFTYVADTVEGFIKAAVTPGVEGKEFNLGANEEISIGDLIARVGVLMGRQLKPLVNQERLRPKGSEVTRLRSDNSKARQQLDWQPHVSLDEGLKQVATWIGAHPELYNPERYGV
jgi:dTDP-glucose 4,6-dehydratase